MDGTQVHSGFWQGAKQHVEDIKQVVQEQDRQAGRHLPVWITGHSLGGGYANCMMLHLLANKRTADLFSAGERLPCLQHQAEHMSPDAHPHLLTNPAQVVCSLLLSLCRLA